MADLLATASETFPKMAMKFDVEEPIQLSPFRHKLQYDAESVFWLFLWWSLQIQPEDKKQDVPIPSHCWSPLVYQVDRRHENFVYGLPQNFLHPEYRPLETLLKQMTFQLQGDHDLCNDPSRQCDEYLHEVFQRLILEFLFQNINEQFMTTKTHDQFRKVDDDKGMSQGSAPMTPGRKRKREPSNERDDKERVSTSLLATHSAEPWPQVLKRPAFVPLRRSACRQGEGG